MHLNNVGTAAFLPSCQQFDLNQHSLQVVLHMIQQNAVYIAAALQQYLRNELLSENAFSFILGQACNLI